MHTDVSASHKPGKRYITTGGVWVHGGRLGAEQWNIFCATGRQCTQTPSQILKILICLVIDPYKDLSTRKGGWGSQRQDLGWGDGDGS